MTNTNIIKTDAGMYGAVNGYPEALGDPVGLIVAILRGTPRLEGAACAGHNPDLWFPDKNERVKRAEAERICADCPVLTECRATARRNGERHGIWAGTKPSVRSQPRGVGDSCKNGHLLVGENAIIVHRSDTSPYVQCRECARTNVELATHCRRGHEFTDDNVTWGRRGDGRRYRKCRACARVKRREWDQKRAAS